MLISKALHSNPSLQAAYSPYRQAQNALSQFQSSFNSQSSKDNTNENDLSEWLKKIFLRGFIEKLMVGFLIYDSYPKIQKGLRLPQNIVLKLGLTLLGALGIGELFARFEEAIESWSSKFFDSGQGPTRDEKNEPGKWNLSTLFAKSLSAIIITTVVIAKKMFFLKEASSPAQTEEEGKFAKISKVWQNAVNKFMSKHFKLEYDAETENKIMSSNLLDSIHHGSKWVQEKMGGSKNPLKAIFGKTYGFYRERVIGCPSLTTIKSEKIKWSAVFFDAMVKMLIFVPLELWSKFILDQETQFYLDQQKKKEGETPNSNEFTNLIGRMNNPGSNNN